MMVLLSDVEIMDMEAREDRLKAKLKRIEKLPIVVLDDPSWPGRGSRMVSYDRVMEIINAKENI